MARDFWVDEKERQGFLAKMFETGQVDGVEVRLRSAGGRVFWARLNAQAVRFRGELTLLGGMIDVTDERQARQNLREIFASAPVALVLSRLDDNTVMDGNQRAAALFDITIEEARGRHAPTSGCTPRTGPGCVADLRERGRVERFEAELKTSEGKRFWAELTAGFVEFDGAPAVLVGSTDISVRKQAEEALRRSESMLRTLLDAAPMPLVVTRLHDGVLRYCNDRAATMFELTVESLRGPAGARLLRRSRGPPGVHGGAGTVRAHRRLRRPAEDSSGRPFWALMNAKTFDLEGEDVFMVGFAEMSAQKELEERLRTLATTDGLTGVFNRRHFLELAEASSSAPRATARHVAGDGRHRPLQAGQRRAGARRRATPPCAA